MSVQDEFFNKIKDGAIKGWNTHKILPSVSLAQSALESNWGKSELVTKGNNLFGIKSGSGWTGKTITVQTSEFVNKKWIKVDASFRKYDSWSDSVADHGEFFASSDWRKNNYKTVIGETDYKKSAKALQSSGYATDPTYADKLIKIIEDYKLNQWDNFKEENNNMPTITKKHTKVNFTDVNINVKYIVMHDTGVKGQSAKNNADYFYSVNRGASAHYFVDEDYIYEVVPPNKKGWHVGDDRAGDKHDVGDLINNSNTIGIELCPESDGTFKSATLANGAWLVQKLMKENKVPAKNVVRHYDASGKNCPQFLNTDGKWSKWYSYHKQLTGQTVTPIATSPAKSATTHTVKAGDTLWGLSKQYNATVAQIKEWNKLKSDTINVGDKLSLKATAPTKNPSRPVSAPVAKEPVGNKNSIVVGIQATVGAKQDGLIGGETKTGIIKLAQRWYGVDDDGVFGKNSQSKAKTIRRNDNGLNVYALQAMLYVKGHTVVGKPDSKFGANTETGVKQFQKANGLTVDGLAGAKTQAKLFTV